MKLSSYIHDHADEILAQWDAFARTMEPASSRMSYRALRDHAREILLAIALDIDTAQNPQEALEKSHGQGAAAYPHSAASIHGTLREVSGFTLVQLTAEFRALRASVLRLWLAGITEFTEAVSGDIMRFNEAVDQALAESAETFSEHGDRTRDTFLAILGHDLRSPLAAISMTGELLERSPENARGNASMGEGLKRSAATMSTMVNDLLEYARTQIGGKMAMTPAPADLADICRYAVHDASAAHPSCPFVTVTDGDLQGQFDSVRLQQVITNLLTNAAQYRARGTPVNIKLTGHGAAVAIEVHNLGPVIPAENLATIFSVLVQLPLDPQQPGRLATSLGLGLFIARETTVAHGGKIAVTSNAADGTTFTVRIPRQPAV